MVRTTYEYIHKYESVVIRSKKKSDYIRAFEVNLKKLYLLLLEEKLSKA